MVIEGFGGIEMLFYILSAVILIFFIFLGYVSHKMTRPERMIGDWTPEDIGFDYEKVSFKTVDDVIIKGWWIDKGSDKTVIGLHGYTSSKWYEVYMKPLLDILKDEDYNILYFDFRAHGESGGKRTTIGDKEYLDLKAAVEWLGYEHSHSTQKLGVIGFSMGAMTALKGSLDDRIDCVVADSPPIDLDATSARSMDYFAGLPSFLYHLTKPVAVLLFDIDYEDMLSYADSIDTPLLLIGGENDPIVKLSEIREFYEINRKNDNDIKIWATEAEHVRSLKENPNKYKDRITLFLKRNM